MFKHGQIPVGERLTSRGTDGCLAICDTRQAVLPWMLWLREYRFGVRLSPAQSLSIAFPEQWVMRPVSEAVAVSWRLQDVFEEACLDAIPDTVIAIAKRGLNWINYRPHGVRVRFVIADVPTFQPKNSGGSQFTTADVTSRSSD